MSQKPLATALQDLNRLIAAIPATDSSVGDAAAARLDRLTKPRGSLGALETLLIQLATAQAKPMPRVDRAVLLIAAADHGVALEGVSAFPQVVTGQMVNNYLMGGAVVNALANQVNLRLLVVDAGIAGPLPDDPHLLRAGVRAGSGNIAREPAMNYAEAIELILRGSYLVDELAEKGCNFLLVGEMGIANTTPSAALTMLLAGASLDVAVGRGTGVDDAGLERKRTAVARALARAEQAVRPATIPLALHHLAEVGGCELALLVGAMLSAARHRIPILLDGYITTAAALVAHELAPALGPYLFASHRSAEPGHQLALRQLGLDGLRAPMLSIGMRLGEGSGAALALGLYLSACRVLRETATFSDAGVTDRS